MRRAPRLVLDTNVVISALLWKGKPGELLVLARDRKARLHSSRVLLDELREAEARATHFPFWEIPLVSRNGKRYTASCG